MSRQLVDIKGGKLTYGQRIELGDIFQDNSRSESKKFVDALKCMFGPDYRVRFTAFEVQDFGRILDGIKFWTEKEQQMLHYDPTPEEVQAGCKELSSKLGPMSTIMSLAHNYAKDPDEILKWEYGKVFGLLYADLEHYKYSKRYEAVINAKYKTHKPTWRK